MDSVAVSLLHIWQLGHRYRFEAFEPIVSGFDSWAIAIGLRLLSRLLVDSAARSLLHIRQLGHRYMFEALG